MAGRLSQQEREVLRLLGLGKTSSEIARALGIAESTVAWYVARSVVRRGGERTDLHAFYIARAATRRALAAMLILALVSLVTGAVVLSRSGALDRARILAPLLPTTPDASPVGGPSASASAPPPDRDGASAAPPTGAPAPPEATPALPVLSLAPLPSIAPPSGPLRPLPLPIPTAIPTLGVPPPPSPRLPAPTLPPVSPPSPPALPPIP